jgi:hypothetical protein
MRGFKVLEHPLRVQKDARRSNVEPSISIHPIPRANAIPACFEALLQFGNHRMQRAKAPILPELYFRAINFVFGHLLTRRLERFGRNLSPTL